jgi:hypothetical protein
MSLLLAVIIDLSTLVFRNDISVADIFIIAIIWIIIMGWNKISSFFNKENERKYFPEIKFRIKNRQESGSAVNVYFCNMPDKKEWQEQMVRDLKIFLQKRAETFRA